MIKFEATLITVKDIVVSREFYENLLGQEVVSDYGENICFKSGIALQTRESFASFIEKSVESIKERPDNAELYFETDNMEDVVKKLDKYGVEYLHRLKEHSWGQRCIRFYDTDMNIIEIGEPMESVVIRYLKSGMSIEDTALKTLQTIKFVEKLALKI